MKKIKPLNVKYSDCKPTITHLLCDLYYREWFAQRDKVLAVVIAKQEKLLAGKFFPPDLGLERAKILAAKRAKQHSHKCFDI